MKDRRQVYEIVGMITILYVTISKTKELITSSRYSDILFCVGIHEATVLPFAVSAFEDRGECFQALESESVPG